MGNLSRTLMLFNHFWQLLPNRKLKKFLNNFSQKRKPLLKSQSLNQLLDQLPAPSPLQQPPLLKSPVDEDATLQMFPVVEVVNQDPVWNQQEKRTERKDNEFQASQGKNQLRPPTTTHTTTKTVALPLAMSLRMDPSGRRPAELTVLHEESTGTSILMVASVNSLMSVVCHVTPEQSQREVTVSLPEETTMKSNNKTLLILANVSELPQLFSFKTLRSQTLPGQNHRDNSHSSSSNFSHNNNNNSKNSQLRLRTRTASEQDLVPRMLTEPQAPAQLLTTSSMLLGMNNNKKLLHPLHLPDAQLSQLAALLHLPKPLLPLVPLTLTLKLIASP